MTRTDSIPATEWQVQSDGSRCLFVNGTKVACIDVNGTLRIAGDIQTNETL